MVHKKIICWSLSFVLLFAYSFTLLAAEQYRTADNRAYAMEFGPLQAPVRLVARNPILDWLNGILKPDNNPQSIWRLLPLLFSHIS